MADRDYYEVLGLTPAADGAAIDTAYWQLARRYQAEAVNDPRASALLDELNEAYNVLGVPYMRADYDAARRAALVGIAAQNARRRPARREEGAAPAFALPAPVIAGAATATLLVGGLGAAWLAGYGVAALVVTLFFGGGAAGAYVLLGNAERLRERFGHPHEASPEARRPRPAPDTQPAQAGPAKAPVARPARLRATRATRQDPGALQASVASTRERWRRAATSVQPESAPDTTLVEIFSSERELESKSGEPLAAVMEILRGARAEEDTSTPSR